MAQMTIWRMRTACWITKATHTHTQRIYNNYCFSTVTMVTPRHITHVATHIARLATSLTQFQHTNPLAQHNSTTQQHNTCSQPPHKHRTPYHFTSSDPSSQYQRFLPYQVFAQHAQLVLPVRSASSDTYRNRETDNNNDHGLLRTEKLVSPLVTMYVCNSQLSVLTTPSLITKQTVSLLEILFSPRLPFLFAHRVLCQPLLTACKYFGSNAHTTCHRTNT
jgi:hypothetical protein